MVDHFGDRLAEKIRKTKSFLCLGVDPHLDLIPEIFNDNNEQIKLQKLKNFAFHY